MTVTVYSKPACVSCTATYTDLKHRGIEFEIKDIYEDESLEIVKGLGYLSAPVVVTDNDHWAGYREDKIDELEAQIKGSVAA